MPDPKFELELEAFYCCPYGLGPGKDGAYRMFVEVMIGKKKKKKTHIHAYTHTHTTLYNFKILQGWTEQGWTGQKPKGGLTNPAQ